MISSIGKQNGRLDFALIEDLARVQEHDALADVGKLVLDLVVLQHGMLGQNLLQQRPQCRNVPLAVAQGVEQPALRVLPARLECQVE